MRDAIAIVALLDDGLLERRSVLGDDIEMVIERDRELNLVDRDAAVRKGGERFRMFVLGADAFIRVRLDRAANSLVTRKVGNDRPGAVFAKIGRAHV